MNVMSDSTTNVSLIRERTASQYVLNARAKHMDARGPTMILGAKEVALPENSRLK